MPNIITFLVYLITGLVTGWQLFQSLLWAVWGAPTYPVQYVGLVSAWALDIAGILVFKKKRASLFFAAFGFIGLWIIYVPALGEALHPAPNVIYDPSAFVAPLLLFVATLYFVLDLFGYVYKIRL